MTIIEQAARRLKELQGGGVEKNSAGTSTREEKTATRLGQAALRDTDAVSNPSLRQDHRERVSTLALVPDNSAPPHITFDLPHLAERGIVIPDAPRTRTSDEFRVIKRPLLANAALQGKQAIRNGNLILITSALPGEGKSFTAANLAMSVAMELNRTVLLVDADVAHPTLPELFGFSPAPGLLDLLADPSLRLTDVLMRTNVRKLSILCSGTRHARATELLASEAMGVLLDDMAQRYSDRIVVFDSPPLLVTSEARVLAAHMGQVVVVVQADKTPQSAVREALAALDQCPNKLMLLNKARGRMQDSYSYSYGYA